MEKAGIDEDALDVLGSYALPVAATAETIREIMGAARPARVHPTTTALAATAGVMATAGILGALWMWGGRDVSALGVGGESTLPARLYVPPRGAWMGPQSRVSLPPTTTVLPPGEEALNWVPAEPGKSAAAVVSTTRYRRAGETGARVNNAYGVYKTFPPAEGVVTVRMWLRPSLDP